MNNLQPACVLPLRRATHQHVQDDLLEDVVSRSVDEDAAMREAGVVADDALLDVQLPAEQRPDT